MKYNIFFYIICIFVGMNFASVLSNNRKVGSSYGSIVAGILAIAWLLYTCPYIK